MKLAVFSHKVCWISPASPSGYATDGGFPIQMRALAELFDETRLVVPVSGCGPRAGEVALGGRNLRIAPVTPPASRGVWRKLLMLPWLLRNGPVLLREALRADAVHTPIPGDIGTVGMIAALLLRKRLFVRHCGNWLAPRTAAEHAWKWLMESFAGGRNVMLATGGSRESPSRRNQNIQWIFSTSLSQDELERSCGHEHPARRLIIACRQESNKGTACVIRSLPLLLADFPDLKLDVVGDGDALERFKALARDLGLNGRIVFHGKVHHGRVMELLQQASLFCYPTIAFEGFPKVVLEALACGLPVITTRISVLPELIGAGCGRLLAEPTPEAMAAAVRECLLDAGRFREMSRKAVETAQNYSLERWREMLAARLSAAWGPLVCDV